MLIRQDVGEQASVYKVDLKTTHSRYESTAILVSINF